MPARDNVPGNAVIDKIIGGNLRVVRVIHGYSQERLGDALGVTFQQIQKYESGANRIAGSRMVQYAKLFRAPIADLFKGVDGTFDIPVAWPSIRASVVARNFDKLNEQGKMAVDNMVRSLLEAITPKNETAMREARAILKGGTTT